MKFLIQHHRYNHNNKADCVDSWHQKSLNNDNGLK